MICVSVETQGETQIASRNLNSQHIYVSACDSNGQRCRPLEGSLTQCAMLQQLAQLSQKSLDRLLCCWRNKPATMEVEKEQKRARTIALDTEHVMHYARIIMERDPFKDRAPAEEDRAFRALFGCGAHVVLCFWNMLEERDLVPEGGELTHLLWVFMYCKAYPTWRQMRRLTGGTDPKTLRKWLGAFLLNAQQLEGDIVSFPLSYRLLFLCCHSY